jgi:hypothetical protein
MLTAIETVHGKNGPWLNDGGYEYNVVLIAAVLTLAELGRERSDARIAGVALLTGAVGALGAHLAAAAAPAEAQETAPATEAATDADHSNAGTVEQGI